MRRAATPPDPAAFIAAHLPLVVVPGTGGLRLRLAGPTSGLSRLVPPGGAPYWAHAWPGGAALAAHLAARPEEAAGLDVLDLGAGCGLAGIAAARAGARRVAAADDDPLALVAARLNAVANGVCLDVGPEDGARPALVLAGDLFYDAEVARRATASLDRHQAAGARVLVGDLGRRFLPLGRLRPVARYPVRDVGDPPSMPPRDGWVHEWVATGKGAP